MASMSEEPAPAVIKKPQSPLRLTLYSLAVLAAGLVAGVVLGMANAPELAVQLDRWRDQENELLTSSLESLRAASGEKDHENARLLKQVNELLDRNAYLEAEIVQLELKLGVRPESPAKK